MAVAGNAVPKELFCYWHQGWDRAPDLVRRCAATWLAHNPSWSVHFLDAESVGEKVSIPRAAKALNLPLPAFSDVVRICLLERGGGVWADATVWCARPLDDWLQPVCRPAGFFAYERPAIDRPVASWFLAAIPDSRIVAIWHDAVCRFLARARWRSLCRRISDSSVFGMLAWPCERLVQRAAARYGGLTVPRSDDPKDENYFWFHGLFQMLLDGDPEFRNLWSSVPKIGAHGPHAMQRLGLLTPATQDVRACIEDRCQPLYKLLHRQHIPADISGTVLDALYRSGGARSL